MLRNFSSLSPEIISLVCQHLRLSDLASHLRTSTFFAWVVTRQLYDRLLLNSVAPRLSTSIAGKLRSKFSLHYFDSNAEKLLAVRAPKGRSILHFIAAAGKNALMDVLLANGADISMKDEDGETPLHLALQKGKEAMAVKLIDAGADVLGLANENPILTYVHINTSAHVVEKLISAIRAAGGNISDCAPDGHTLIGILVANGADVFATNKYGHPPLISAILQKRIAASKILLEAMRSDPRGYDINQPIASLKNVPWPWAPETVSRVSDYGDTILHAAVRTWNTAVVQLLLDFGANPSAQNNYTYGEPQTPFDIAILGRCPEMVVLIAGMDNTPFFWTSNGYIQEGLETCVRESYPETVRVLCGLYKEGKVELDFAPVSKAMLEACTSYGDHVPDQDVNDTIAHVVSAGTNVNVQDGMGRTTQHLLCDFGDDEHRDDAKIRLMKYLLDQGADWRIRDSEGNTVLHTAAKHQESDPVIRHILGKIPPTDKAIVGSGSSDGNTPLHVYAASFATAEPECISTVKLLVNSGCDPNAVNSKEKTFAHLSMTQWLLVDVIKLFSELGGNLSSKDYEGRPPIHHAATMPDMDEFHRKSIAKYFVEEKADLHEGCTQCDSLVLELHRKI